MEFSVKSYLGTSLALFYCFNDVQYKLINQTTNNMPKKILVIEDDDLLRGLITQRLDKEDYVVIQAIDGTSGLKAVTDQMPDLVLLDIILPGMDGFEVLEKIKNDTALSHIPVAMLSNLSQQEDIDKAKKLGAIDYFIKINFTSEEIINKIKNLVK